jgi:hypothetical protein
MSCHCKTGPVQTGRVFTFYLRYLTLQKSGDVESLEEITDLSLVRGLSDEKLQNAIADLKRSTSAIEKQTETLRIQQDALSSLVKSNRKDSEARSAVNSMQHRAWTAEFRTLSSEVSYKAFVNPNLLTEHE